MEFRILGPTDVVGALGRTQLRGSRQSALLAALILQANRVVSIEQLMDAVFGDDQAGTATIHTYVSRLRRALEGVEENGGERIVTKPTGYLLRIEPGELDLEVFRGHVERGRREAAAGHWEQAAAAFEAGLRLWRDSPLVDISSSTLNRNEVPRLIEERLSALERRIAADLELGRHDDLIGELRALTADHPFREQFWAQLMLSLYRSGRAAEALEVYQQLRTLRADELGIDPGPELQRLHQAILNNDPSLTPRTAKPETPAASPAPAAMPPPAQLPPDVVGFVGREEVKAKVSELLTAGRPGATPLVVLVGLPGIGKTTLATHVAHTLRGHFPDGQLYVNLRGYADAPPVSPNSVLSRFLRALGVPPDFIPLDLDEQTALYRSLLADKRVLVVLDNANSADHVRPLLPAGEQCAVLVTSRDDLAGLTALQGATRFTLDALAPSASHSLLSTAIDADRVASEPDAADELSALCGNLPLALRIAAANLSSRPYLGIGEYVAQLRAGDRLAELAVQGDEQAAVRAAFDLSYSVLKPEEARLFRYLGLVPGPDFTVHTAAALADTTLDRAGALLGHLRVVNLILDSGPGRYQFHDLLRQYAIQQGAAIDNDRDRAEATRRLYSFYFAATAEASSIIEPIRPKPEPPEDLAEVPLPDLSDADVAMAWIEREMANLQAAIGSAAEQGPFDFAWHLADAMTAPLVMTTRFEEWVELSRLGLRAALREGGEAGEAGMRMSLGYAYNTIGRQDLAIEELGRALTLFERLDEERHQILCHYPMGMAHLWTGQLTEAIEHLRATGELGKRLDFTYYEANAVHGLGVAHRYLGDLETGTAELLEALEIGRRVDNPYVHATWRLSLGFAYRDLGRYDEALAELAEARRGFGELDNALGECRAEIGIADVQLERGKVSEALDKARDALGISRKINHRRAETDALNTLARVYARQDRLADALDHHETARTVAEGMGPYAYGMIEARIGLAEISRRLGKTGDARGHVEIALAAIRARRFRLHESAALTVLAKIEADKGKLDDAAAHCADAVAAGRKSAQRPRTAVALRLLGEIKAAAKDATADKHRDEARALFDELGVPETE